MKKDIHPKYYPQAEITCACGNKFKVGATKEKMEVEICSNCHPFFTGEKQLIDTAGRAEKFIKRKSKAKADLKKKSEKRREKKVKKTKENK